MKSFFSLVNSVVGGESKVPEKKVTMPWEDYKAKAKSLNIRGSLTDIIRDKILEIPLDEKILLKKTTQLGTFDLEFHLEVILKLLEIDPNLREVFRKNVPGRISEEFFWKNYFERVEEVENEVLSRFSNAKSTNESYHNSLIDELDKELEGEIEDFSYQKRPIPSPAIEKQNNELKALLETALKRIEILEKRVAILEEVKTGIHDNELEAEAQ